MQINSKSTYKVKDTKPEVQKKALKIEAAHSGIVNSNYIFYTPSALRDSAESILKFYKPLQNSHYGRTIGYLYDSYFDQKVEESPYLDRIEKATSRKELGEAVKEYCKSPDYLKNREGFGVLVSKANLYDTNKITKLSDNDIGHVSIAGDGNDAVCSICYGVVGSDSCTHKLGAMYKQEVCFAILDNFEVDHISFEAIPANFKTKSFIVADSNTFNMIELIEEGHLMHITLEDLQKKVENPEALFTELGYTDFLEQYKETIEKANKSDFLFPTTQTLPITDTLGILVAMDLVAQLEESEDKKVLEDTLAREFKRVCGEITVEEAKESLTKVEETKEVVDTVVDTEVVEKDNEPSKEADVEVKQVLEVTDANTIFTTMFEQLTSALDEKVSQIKESVVEAINADITGRANQHSVDRITALQEDLTLSSTLSESLTTQLKQSIIGQIVLLKQVDVESDYFASLQKRTVKELQLTLEDHQFATTQSKVVETPIVKEKEQKPLETQTKESVIDTMGADTETKTVLDVQDADKILTGVLASIEGVSLTKDSYANLYKTVAKEHGSPVAKRLHVALKQQYRI